MLKKLWEKISGHQSSYPEKSIRTIGKDLGISKDMVHRHQKRESERSTNPMSSIWNSAEGQAFLKRLIVSTIYTFGIKGGVGSGRIEEFMKQIQISTHAGVSESSIYRMMKEVEASIMYYQSLREKEFAAQASEQLEHLEVTLGLDETWLNDMLLVCQELTSGYIFLKSQAKKETEQVGINLSKSALKNTD